MSNSVKSHAVIQLSEDLGLIDRTDLSVYIVDSNGKVTESVAFNANAARLQSSKGIVRSSRVFVGPAFPKDYNPARIDAIALAKIGAYQIPVDFTVGNTVTVHQLPSSVIQHPIYRLCNVSGNVRNTVDIDGVPVSGPVCKARVHVCRVEWVYWWPVWLLPQVPLSVLNELKEKFIALQWANYHPPLPDPAPDTVLPKTNLPLRSLSGRAKITPTAATLQPLPAAVHEDILSATTDSIHGVIQKYAGILYPYFCRWPLFWPWFYRVEEEVCVDTDCNGHYNAWLVSFFGTNIPENIYVWVETLINGHWVTVYRPPFPCYTHWNYTCGTEINISLYNPFIPPCTCDTQVPDGTVWFTAIGWYGIALNIQQDEAHTVELDYLRNSMVQKKFFKNVGCTNLGDANQLAPFGSQLDLFLAFGPTAPANATHYRWKQTLILDSNQKPFNNPAPSIVPGAVTRTYLWPLPAGGFGSGSISLLDPDASGAVGYKIPPYTPTGLHPFAEWEHFNFVSASVDTSKIPDGCTVRFDLELLALHNNVFQVVSVPTSTFVVSANTDYSNGYGGTVPAPPDYLTLDSANPPNAKSFSLKVRIDNSEVTASVYDVWLLDANGNPIPGSNSGPCGFIHYPNVSAKARVSFMAWEPFSLATFDFHLVKGDSGDVIPALSGYVFEDAGLFTQSGGLFTADIPLSILLGSCVQAAFSELLNVYSLATNGYSRLSGSGHLPYYATDLKAFALSDH